MRNILKLGLFLLVVAGLAGFGISYVNGLTAPLIAEQMQQDKEDSFKEVYPQGQEIKDESQKYLKDPSSMVKEMNIVYDNGTAAGVIYTVEPSGYGGTVKILVGFDITTKKITGIKVLSHTETPGLGAQAAEDFFQSRFKDKNAAEPIEIVKKEPVSGNQVMAITAATVTSKAVASGVNAARENFETNFAK